MKNINDYKKRFYNLMESTMGDSKPLINEQYTPEKEITQAFQTLCNTLNAARLAKLPDTATKKYPQLTVKKTIEGNLGDVWKFYLGNKEAHVQGVYFHSIADSNYKLKPGGFGQIRNNTLTPMSNYYAKLLPSNFFGFIYKNAEAICIKTITDAIAKFNPTRPQ
jgi:hypothetical protein